MAAIAAEKQKCQFWDKCYRKNKKHLEKFLHPNDTKNDTSSDAPKHRLTHEISVSDADTTPASNRGKKRNIKDSEDCKAEGDVSSSSTTITKAASPAKKLKTEETDEIKITVNYNKPKKATHSNDASTSKAADGAAGTTKPPKTIVYKGRKEKCKYWDKCYQTGDDHKKEFLHPGDDIPAEPEETSKTRQQANTPLNPLEDGGTVEFEGTKYVLKRNGDIYSCICKGFLIQRAPINERTCKHLKEYLGEEFDKARLAKSVMPKKTGIKSHIQVSLLLAHKYEEKSNNPVGWWISEKLDGVRAFWNGRCFYSRLGNAFYAPDWFTQNLPTDMTLDGELFGGRGEFQSTVRVVKTAMCPDWKDLKYHVFDSPSLEKSPFEERMNAIKEYLEEHQPEYVVFVEQTQCKSKTHLDEKLERILNLGGEGLMIRKPKSLYERSRSHTLLKIKKFYDAEAIVIGHEQMKGYGAGRCGSLRCKMACGKEFSVGSGMTNEDRNNPPKIGSIITYKFQELTKSGVPRFPTYLGVCIDKTEPKDAEIREVLKDDDA